MENGPASSKFNVFIVIILVLLVINSVLLDYVFVTYLSGQNAKGITYLTTNVLPTPIGEKKDSFTCSDACKKEIQAIVQSIDTTGPDEEAPTITPTTKTVVSEVKEYFVGLGTGSVQSQEWVDVSGVSATIDTKNYPHIEQVTFEASLEISTGVGKSYVRLYNATDKHPVWYSEMSLDGATPKLLVSGPIALDAGNKTYQVQMKNTLNVLTKLNQSRIHIILN